ncbi:NHL repeat-containing protein [Serratia marcescens]|uniref:hypothetical protein n=1 Tax=Serratia marcescens TaxID=615 RepID=UPI001F296739|nr:hypothetical protein [Serratia marcescens]
MSYAVTARAALLALAAAFTLSVPAQAAASADCTESSMTLPPGALYPNGIARATDGTLYVGLITSGNVLRKRPGQAWETFFPGADTVFASNALRLDERRGLLWGNSPDFLSGGKTRANRIYALNVADGTLNRSLALPAGEMGNDIVLGADGTVYVTETRGGGILRLRPGEAAFSTLFQDARLAAPSGLGAAGIVLLDDRLMAVANFGTGKLYTLSYNAPKPQLTEMRLPRLIENPDGMGLAPDGALIVLENGIQSGQGRIPSPKAAGTHRIEVLREGMESPVNLTITPQGCAFVSESRIRHRLLPGHETEVPDSFRLYQLPLPLTAAK